MTVTYKGIIPESRRASNRFGVRTYTEVHRLITDSRTDSAYTIGSNPNLPVIGQSHQDDPLAWCNQLDVECTDGYTGWTVTATYSSDYELNDNPLNDPVRVRFDGEKYQVVADQDQDGAAILNSAGDYFYDPAVMRDKTGLMISLTKNLYTAPSYVLSLPDAVNSTTFSVRGVSFSARQAKVDRVSISDTQERNGISFITLQIEIQCRAETWDIMPLQAGYSYLKDGKRIRAVNEGDNTPVTTPVLLNSAGEIIENPLPSQAEYGQFRVYPEIDFNTYLPLT